MSLNFYGRGNVHGDAGACERGCPAGGPCPAPPTPHPPPVPVPLRVPEKTQSRKLLRPLLGGLSPPVLPSGTAGGVYPPSEPNKGRTKRSRSPGPTSSLASSDALAGPSGPAPPPPSCWGAGGRPRCRPEPAGPARLGAMVRSRALWSCCLQLAALPSAPGWSGGKPQLFNGSCWRGAEPPRRGWSGTMEEEEEEEDETPQGQQQPGRWVAPRWQQRSGAGVAPPAPSCGQGGTERSGGSRASGAQAPAGGRGRGAALRTCSSGARQAHGAGVPPGECGGESGLSRGGERGRGGASAGVRSEKLRCAGPPSPGAGRGELGSPARRGAGPSPGSRCRGGSVINPDPAGTGKSCPTGERNAGRRSPSSPPPSQRFRFP